MKKEIRTLHWTGLLSLLMAYFILGTGCETRDLILDAKDFGLQKGIDNTPAIIAALEASKAQKATKLIFPPGRYDLYPEKANEEFKNISNNDDGKKRISHQQGFEFAAKGDRIQLVDRFNLKPYAEVTVLSVNNRNDYYFEVTIDQPLEGILHQESVAENISWQADVVMRNCIVRNNRARSILISTAGDVLIENNHFKKCTYAGVLTAGDADFWFESGPFRNIIIRDNIFEDLGLAGGSAPVLGLLPHVDTNIDPEWYYHQNLVFERNTINTFSRNIVSARSVKDIVFKDNIINQSENYVSVAKDDDPVFVFEDCRDIQIEGNQYNWEKEASIRLLGRTTDVRAEKNHNIEIVNR